MQQFGRQFSTRQTSQAQPIPGKPMTKNSAGGYSFEIDKWEQLRRFLVLGTEGGTYYVGQSKLTRENCKAVAACIAEDGDRTVGIITAISEAGRAPKNDPALFALALCTSPDLADERTRSLAYAALPRVARIGTHLFHFAEYRKAVAGWGAGMRKAVQGWYLNREPDQVAYQAVKYRQRDGWSHRDLLRKAHPKATDPAMNAVFKYIVSGTPQGELPRIIEGFERAQAETDAKSLAGLVRDYGLTWEMIPTEMHEHKQVWDALLDKMPMGALVRQLPRLTRLGLVKSMGARTAEVCDRLADEGQLCKARIHPIQVLAALLTYASGHSTRGSSEWVPVTKVVDALDAAFYASFGNVEPTGKRIMLCLDVSGSMSGGWGGAALCGVPGLSARMASSAMALITANVEADYCIMAFTHGFVPLQISPNQRLDDVCHTTERLPFDRTDCAVPMLWAIQEDLEVDAFIVYTDSETWAGNIHPVQALQRYRQKTGINAKSVVVGMESNGFTIADPDDAGMLDVVGFDTATPNAISSFVRG